MLKLLKKKSVYWSIIIVAIIAFLLIWNGITKTTNYSDKYAGFDFSKIESEGRADSYTAYRAKYRDAGYPTTDIQVDLRKATGDCELADMFGGWYHHAYGQRCRSRILQH